MENERKGEEAKSNVKEKRVAQVKHFKALSGKAVLLRVVQYKLLYNTGYGTIAKAI